MTNDLITVCTCTLGDSESRLRVLLPELRKFTNLPFRHVVLDDGTSNENWKIRQVCACGDNQAEWHENLGPTYGISYAWNHALELVKTPWAYCIEDGLRPSMGWLETAVDFVERIGDKWGGWGPNERRVGMAGFCHIQDWLLGIGGAWQGDPMRVFHGEDSYFYNDWNDGYWCWNRMLPEITRAINGDTSRWQSDVLLFKQLMEGCTTLVDPHTGLPPHPTDVEQAQLKWRRHDHWPARRAAFPGWYPGAFMLVNLDLWRQVGRFRDGCSFFEGHLGVRMGLAGHLSMCVEGPPWLHCPSQGFKISGNMRTPRDHRDTTQLFKDDFQGWDSMDAPNKLASAVVAVEEQRAINAELAQVELHMAGGWEKWV